MGMVAAERSAVAFVLSSKPMNERQPLSLMLTI